VTVHNVWQIFDEYFSSYAFNFTADLKNLKFELKRKSTLLWGPWHFLPGFPYKQALGFLLY
jgi:hypothetical protein